MIAFVVVLVTSMWHSIGLPTQQYCGNKDKDVHSVQKYFGLSQGKKWKSITVRNREELKSDSLIPT